MCQTLKRIRGGMRPNAHNNCSLAAVQTGPLRRSATLTLALVAVLAFYCIIGDHRSAPRCIFGGGGPGLPFRARHARLVCRTLLSHHGLSALLSSPRASAAQKPLELSIVVPLASRFHQEKLMQRCTQPCPVSAPDLRWATQPGCLHEKVQLASSTVSSPHSSSSGTLRRPSQRA